MNPFEERPVRLGRLLAVSCALLLPTTGLAQAPRMVPAQVTNVVDKLGFNWDIQKGGYIGQGTNRSISGGGQFVVDGSVYHPTSGTMTPDRSEFLYRGARNNWKIERRMKVDLAAGVVRYVDSLTNMTPQQRGLRFGVLTNLGRSSATQIVTNGGKNPAPQLPAGEEGVLCWTDPRFGQVAVLLHLADPRSKVRPTLSNSNNRTFRFDWNLTVGPNETVSIAHAIAQRRYATAPSGRNLQREFEALRSTRWMETLPSEIRGTIANRELNVIPKLGPSLLSPERIDIIPDELDTLAMGTDSKLLGTATFEDVTLETRFGSIQVPRDRLRTVVGPRHAVGTSGVLLTDGQCLTGLPAFEDITFTLRGGLTTAVVPGQLDRLVFRRPEKSPPAATALLETVHGDRLAINVENSAPLPATTPWGRRLVEWNELLRLVAQPTGGFVLELADGTKSFCFLETDELTIRTLEFGERTLAAADIRMLSLAPPKTAEDGEGERVEGTTPETAKSAPPRFELVGDNLLAGELVADHFQFETETQEIKLVVSQVRTLRALDDGDETGRRTWEARVWNGSVLRGRVLDRTLVVRMADGSEARVPVRDLERFHVPTLPQSVRELVDELVADLGHTEYDRRDAATRELVALVDVVRPVLEGIAKDASKLEVKRRLERVLEKGDGRD